MRANLKRYRASVLKAAVEGRLVPTEAELARKEGREFESASILKWAFEGKLVDQDPNDEPASVLLKRIRAERAAAATPSRKSRKPITRQAEAAK